MPYLKWPASIRLLGAQLAIGAAAIFARYALHGAKPLAIAALRLGLAALVALALAGRFERMPRRSELLLAAAGAALAVHFASWLASLDFTSVAASTLLVTTTPIWTELYAVARTRRPPARAFTIVMVTAAGGVALLVLAPVNAAPPIRGHEGLGDSLALGGSVAIGAYLLLVRSVQVPSPASTAPGTRQIVARTYCWAALFLSWSAIFWHQAAPPLADTAAWGGILAMALVSQSLGHTALNAALRYFSPSVVALTTLLEPVFAALLAAALFGEVLSPAAALGGALVLLAVGVILRSSAPTSALSRRSRNSNR